MVNRRSADLYEFRDDMVRCMREMILRVSSNTTDPMAPWDENTLNTFTAIRDTWEMVMTRLDKDKNDGPYGMESMPSTDDGMEA